MPMQAVHPREMPSAALRAVGVFTTVLARRIIAGKRAVTVETVLRLGR